MLGPPKARCLDRPVLAAPEQLVPPGHFYRHLDAALDRGCVRAWVCGRQFAPEAPHRISHRTRTGRTLDRLGYLRFRNWCLYGERGLAGERAAVWLYEQTLTIAYGDEALAQYHVTYQPDRRHLDTVDQPRLYETPHRSPQPSLWALGDSEWPSVLRLPA